MICFSFNSFNHCEAGQRAIEDLSLILGHQVMALGHEARWSNVDFVRREEGYNIVFESFADPRFPALPLIAERHRAGCRFVFVATEKPAPGAFNGATDDPGMIERQRAFPIAAKLCDGILHLVPGDDVTAWYSRHAPAAYAELGYSPSLARGPGPEPDHDFGFFGKRTVRRMTILAELAKRGSVLAIHDFVPREERDRRMQRAKIIVQIREFEETSVASSSRLNTSLSIGRPVIAEPHGFCGEWANVIRFSESLEAFYDDAIAALPHWHELHAGQFERFKAAFPPEVCLGEPLRKIGVLQ
jgi:hypothetical protein